MTSLARRAFDLLSKEELAIMLSWDVLFVLPRGTRDRLRRMAEARELLSHDYRAESLPMVRWRSARRETGAVAA